MQIYFCETYREWIKQWMKEQPKGGHGVSLRLAEAIGVSTVLISQILNGQREMQLEHAHSAAKFMHLNKKETEFFILLVCREKAGTKELADYWSEKIDAFRSSVTQIKDQVKTDIDLNETAKAQFYSHWLYSAVRLSTDIPELKTPAQIAKKLGTNIEQVTNIIGFLVENGLCSLVNGKYKMAARSTFLDKESPWFYSRQIQWRHKAIQKMENTRDDQVFYTGPMVISKKDFTWIGENIVKKAIKNVSQKAIDSESEMLACLNIDWFPVCD